jgi:hypothetical protein
MGEFWLNSSQRTFSKDKEALNTLSVDISGVLIMYVNKSRNSDKHYVDYQSTSIHN